MMATNILTMFDAWLDTWPGDGGDPAKLGAGNTQAASMEAANDLMPSLNSMMFHSLTERPGNTSAATAKVQGVEPVTTTSGPVEALWQPLADEYYCHHFGCLYCIAAGQNQNLSRCSIGGPLWRAYQMATKIADREA